MLSIYLVLTTFPKLKHGLLSKKTKWMLIIMHHSNLYIINVQAEKTLTNGEILLLHNIIMKMGITL